MSLSSKGPDGVVAVRVLEDLDARVFLATHSGRVIIFRADSLKFLRGTGKGVNAIRIAKGDRVIDFALGGPRDSLAVVTSRGRDVNVTERKYGLVRRGGKGFEVIKRGTLKATEPDAVVLAHVEEEEESDEDELDAIADELEDALAAVDGEASHAEETSEEPQPVEQSAPEAPEEPDEPATDEEGSAS